MQDLIISAYIYIKLYKLIIINCQIFLKKNHSIIPVKNCNVSYNYYFYYKITIILHFILNYLFTRKIHNITQILLLYTSVNGVKHIAKYF